MERDERKAPSKSAGAPKDRVDMWFVRLAWIVAAALVAFMLYQAFSMRPADPAHEEPAITSGAE